MVTLNKKYIPVKMIFSFFNKLLNFENNFFLIFEIILLETQKIKIKIKSNKEKRKFEIILD